MHPAVVDGRTAWIFLEASAACRGGTDGDATEPLAFDHAAVRLLDGEHEGHAVEVCTRSTNAVKQSGCIMRVCSRPAAVKQAAHDSPTALSKEKNVFSTLHLQ